MTVATTEQGPQKRYRRLRFPSFDADVWAEKNPLLQKGELGHEKDTGRFKVGDGVTYWSDLPYNSVGDSAKVNGYNVLEIVAGNNVEIEQSGNVLTIGASGVGYSKQEIDDKFTVANAQIDANATAIQKTRDDMNEEDGRLQTQITAHAAAITALQNEQTATGNQIQTIESKIPDGTSDTNPLINKQQLLDEEMDIREDLNSGLSELQTQITHQAAEIVTKQDKLIAGDNIVISGNIISATGAGGGTGFDVQVVQELPATGQKGIIYLLAKDGAAPDVYDEYVWIETTQTFELIGTTQVDLTDYVKNTDYAASGKAGLVVVSKNLGTATNVAGYLQTYTLSLEEYKELPSFIFIGKGTLENIKDDLVARAIENTVNTQNLTVGSGEGTLYIGDVAGTATIATNNGLDIAAQTKFDTAPTTDDNTTYADALEVSFMRKAQVATAIADAVANVDALPDQSGNAGKVLMTDGSKASWQEAPAGGTKVIIKRYE